MPRYDLGVTAWQCDVCVCWFNALTNLVENFSWRPFDRGNDGSSDCDQSSKRIGLSCETGAGLL